MLDFGESRTLVLDTEREKRDIRLALPWCMLSPCSWTTWVRGVLGEGVRGARPPARRVEKTPSRRDLTGVNTDAVAIFAYENAFLALFLYCGIVNGSSSMDAVFGNAQMAQLRDPVSILREYSAVCRRWVCWVSLEGLRRMCAFRETFVRGWRRKKSRICMKAFGPYAPRFVVRATLSKRQARLSKRE